MEKGKSNLNKVIITIFMIINLNSILLSKKKLHIKMMNCTTEKKNRLKIEIELKEMNHKGKESKDKDSLKKDKLKYGLRRNQSLRRTLLETAATMDITITKDLWLRIAVGSTKVEITPNLGRKVQRNRKVPNSNKRKQHI